VERVYHLCSSLEDLPALKPPTHSFALQLRCVSARTLHQSQATFLSISMWKRLGYTLLLSCLVVSSFVVVEGADEPEEGNLVHPQANDLSTTYDSVEEPNQQIKDQEASQDDAAFKDAVTDAVIHHESVHRELRQSIFCRCVADYEDFYENRRAKARSMTTYYNPWSSEETTTTRSSSLRTDTKYFNPEYRQGSVLADDVSIGEDGWYIVDGITVLPLDNEACVVSQTNAALRTFLQIFYGPNTQSRQNPKSIWNMFSNGGGRRNKRNLLKGSRKLDNSETDEKPKPSTMLRTSRELQGWADKRRDRRRKRDETIWQQDLSQGTAYETRDVPRVFPCPPDPPETDPPTAAPVTAAAPSDVPSLSPTISQVPTLQPQISIATQPPSRSPTVSPVPTVLSSSAPSFGPTISVRMLLIMIGAPMTRTGYNSAHFWGSPSFLHLTFSQLLAGVPHRFQRRRKCNFIRTFREQHAGHVPNRCTGANSGSVYQRRSYNVAGSY